MASGNPDNVDDNKSPGEDRGGLPNGNWQSVLLGSGGQGTAHSWVQVDANQKIIDRLVIKDSWISAKTDEPEVYRGIYEELVQKAMNLSDAVFGSSSRPPFYKEAYIQGLLTPESRTTQSDTVRLRGYRRGNGVDPNGTPGSIHWRLFMDHCYAGDLGDFVDYHEAIGKPVPEPFIWWTMECLASALVQMETCARARSHAREQKDETVVMVDMKPSNIFLDGAGYSERYPVYPRPKVGDFGSAHLTHMQDPANIFCKLEITWSPGFLAPELSRPSPPEDEEEASNEGDDEDEDEYEDEDEGMDDAEPTKDDAAPTKDEELHAGDKEPDGFLDDQDDDSTVYTTSAKVVKSHVEETEEYLPLYSWTNVWQLGRTIEYMMRLRYSRDRDWDNDTVDRNSRIKVDPPRHRAEPNFLYSEDLIDIVWQCGQYEAKSRPTPSKLLDMIKSMAPKHIHRMDVWGTESWVAEQYEDTGTLTEDHKKYMKASIKERARAGKLWFLNDFEDQNLAAQYRELDLDPPQGCELTWTPNAFRNRIGQILGAEDPEPEPESSKRKDNKRPRTDEAITMTYCHKKPRI